MILCGLEKENVVIIGTGGHAKVVADIVRCSNDTIVGFLDGIKPYGEFLGYPVLGSDDDYVKYQNYKFIVAIGNPNVRERIVNKLENVRWYTAVHPTAIISDLDTAVDEGTMICANAVVNAGARIGKHCIINTGSCVEHDNFIEDFVHISVGTKLAGHVKIGRSSWIGIGATVNNDVSICSDCTIGAGAVVIKDIISPGTYVGVPAGKIK